MNFKTTYILFGVLVAAPRRIAASSLLTGPKRGEEGKLLAGHRPAKDVTRVVDRAAAAGRDQAGVRPRRTRTTGSSKQPYEARLDGRQVESMVSRHHQRPRR